MVFVFRLGAFQTQVFQFFPVQSQGWLIYGAKVQYSRGIISTEWLSPGVLTIQVFISKSKLEQVVVRTAGFKRRGFNHDKL